MASQKRATKSHLKTIPSQKLYINNLTKAKNRFKKPKDTSEVELSDLEILKQIDILV